MGGRAAIPFRWAGWKICVLAFSLITPLSAQESIQTLPDSDPATTSQANLPAIDTTQKKWQNFVHETIGPLSFGATAFNATFSQVTQTNPQYGTGGAAFAKRLGASYADIATENFFGDFLVASFFHEDPRYHRKGPGRSTFYRAAYAVSRAFVTRKDDGTNGFNFNNVLGNALSVGFSNVYYPPPSRTAGAMLSHFTINVVDSGFVNLAPEFWPDFRDKVLRRHRHH